MAKLFGASKLMWAIAFVGVQIVNLGLLVGAMDYDHWFYQYWSFNRGGISDFKFIGRLLTPSIDFSPLCHDSDYYKKCYDNCHAKSEICERFESWQNGGGTYVALDTIGSILSVLNAALLILEAVKFKYLKSVVNMFTTAFIMIVIFVLHFLAYVIWAGTVKLEFSDCTHDINYSGTKSVCGDGGAVFGLLNIFYLLFVTPAYFYIAFRLRQEERKELSQTPTYYQMQNRG